MLLLLSLKDFIHSATIIHYIKLSPCKTSAVKHFGLIRLLHWPVIGPVTPFSVLSLASSYCLSSIIHGGEGGSRTTIPTQGQAVRSPETLSSLRPKHWVFLAVLYHYNCRSCRSFGESIPEKLLHLLKSRNCNAQ